MVVAHGDHPILPFDGGDGRRERECTVEELVTPDDLLDSVGLSPGTDDRCELGVDQRRKCLPIAADPGARGGLEQR